MGYGFKIALTDRARLGSYSRASGAGRPATLVTTMPISANACAADLNSAAAPAGAPGDLGACAGGQTASTLL